MTTEKDAYLSFEMQLQRQFLNFFHKSKSLLPATSILFLSPIAYNLTSSTDKLTRTDYVDFDKCQDSFEQFSWSKNDSNYLDVKLKVLKKDDNKEIQLIQNLTKGEAEFTQFTRMRNQLVNAAGKLC